MRIGDTDGAALDPQNAIGLIAELKNIASQAFDREILMHAADELIVRLEKHPVIGVVGDRAAGGQRGQPRPAPAAQPVIDGIVMDQRAAPATPGRETFGKHLIRQLAKSARVRLR